MTASRRGPTWNAPQMGTGIPAHSHSLCCSFPSWPHFPVLLPGVASQTNFLHSWEKKKKGTRVLYEKTNISTFLY